MKNTSALLIGICLFGLTVFMKENSCTCTTESNGKQDNYYKRNI